MSNNITISIVSNGRNRYEYQSPFKFALTPCNESGDNYYTNQIMSIVANGVPHTTLPAGTNLTEGTGGGLGAHINFNVGTLYAPTLKGKHALVCMHT